MMGRPLTAAFVAHAKKPGRYRDERNLYLEVTKTGHKGWLFRYERNGQGRWMSLGPASVVTLKEAREKAHEARRTLHNGIDPLAQRHAECATARAAELKHLTFQAA